MATFNSSDPQSEFEAIKKEYQYVPTTTDGDNLCDHPEGGDWPCPAYPPCALGCPVGGCPLNPGSQVIEQNIDQTYVQNIEQRVSNRVSNVQNNVVETVVELSHGGPRFVQFMRVDFSARINSQPAKARSIGKVRINPACVTALVPVRDDNRNFDNLTRIICGDGGWGTVVLGSVDEVAGILEGVEPGA